MRSFVISLIILGLCFGLCCLNTALTQHKIDRSIDELNALLPDDIDRFAKSWQDADLLFSFTVKRTFLREIADALQRLKTASEHDDEYEYETARTSLIYKMKELALSQSFNVKSIF